MTIDEIKQLDWTVYGIYFTRKQINNVIDWNNARGLLSTFDLALEKRLLSEESQELVDALIKGDVHETVDAINDMQVVFIGTVTKYLLNATLIEPDVYETSLNYINTVTELVSTSFEEVTSLGFEPKCAFNETLLEINSRVGSTNSETGKWTKDNSPEAQAKWYKANFNLCELANKEDVINFTSKIERVNSGAI